MPLSELPEQAVASLPLFKGMAEQERRDFAAAGKIQPIRKGELLFQRGDDLDKLFIVAKGAIRQFRETPDGKEVTVGMVMHGEMVCSSHIFDGLKNYQWNAMAAEDSVILEYPTAWFKEKVKTTTQLALNLLAAMAHQSEAASVEAEHRVTFTAAQRVGCFLLRSCAVHGFDPKDFELPYSKSTIASALGMELETFSRTLKKLKEIGVTVEKSHVTVQNVHALECYICNHCSLSGECETIAMLEEQCAGRKLPRN